MHLRKKNYIHILFLLCLWGSSENLWAGISTRLTIRIIDPKANAQLAVTTPIDDLNDTQKDEVLNLRTEQEFTTSFVLENPTPVTVKYDGATFELYMEPGDDLFVSFEAPKFPESMLFMGKGTEHNNYLLKFRTKFANTKDNILTNLINNFTPEDYKKWLTENMKKRWTFFHDYDGLEKEAFSKKFNAFICAEIDYWYAYHLLRYKEEHTRGNVLSKFVQIPERYYDFLNNIIINNDEALVHPLYRKFLKLYLNFREEYPASFFGLASKQMTLTVKVPSMELLATPTNKIVGYITQGTKVLVLDKLTVGSNSNTPGILPTAYRIRVKTNDGQEGWIKTNGLEFDSEPQLNPQSIVIETIESSSKKAVMVARVGFRLLNVMSEPYENSVIETLRSSQEAFYLNQKTDQTYNYKDQDSIIHTSSFVKVRTASGRIGWVCAAGITLVEKEIEDKQRRQRIGSKFKNAYNNIDFLLAGKSRLFALATNIDYRLHFETPQAVKMEYDLFMRENTSNYLRSEVEKIYQNAINHPIAIPASVETNTQIIGVFDIMLNVQQARFRVDANPTTLVGTPPRSNYTTSSSTTNQSNTSVATNTTTIVNTKPKVQIGTGININKKTEGTTAPTEAIVTPQTVAKLSDPNAARLTPINNTSPVNQDIATTTPTTVASTTNASNGPPKADYDPYAKPAIATDLNLKKIEVKMPNAQYDLIGSSITGRITDPRGITIMLNLTMDVVNGREATYNTKLDANNSFRLDFFLAEPAVGELICGSDTIPVYLEPNDQLAIELNGKDKNFLACSGQGSAHVMFMDGYRNFSKPIDRQVKGKTRTLNAEAFKAFMAQSRDTKLQFLENYTDKFQFTDNFMAYAKGNIDYWYSFYLMNYPWEYPLYYNEAPPSKVPPNYYDFLAQLPKQNDAAMPSQNYRFFLNEYMSDLSRKNKNNTPRELAEKYLTGKSLAYVRAKQVAQDLAFDINAQKIGAVKQYVQSSKYPLYNEAVVAALYRSLPVQTGASAPSFRLMTADGREVTLEQLKGKIVYLDFWATWCAPCINSLPHVERVRQRFNENEVVFVYINLDEDRSKWIRYLQDHPLGGQHVSGNSPNPYRETVSSLYQATKLPATVLIDREGNIVSDSNEHLDSDAIAVRIQNLISK